MSVRLNLSPGTEPLSGYTLVRIRGRGGFAEVWEAVDASGKPVALKFMGVTDQTAAAKEIRALQFLQKLSHPNLLRTDRVWSMPGYIVIAMELAEGSLIDLLDVYQAEFKTCIEPAVILNYLEQAARALDFLNTRQHVFDGRRVGFQHCDIKPSNLLITGENLKLADYGLATPTTSMNNAYPRWGTLEFAAPEIWRGILTERSDQYSLAITYYYLRTSRFPFPAPPKSFDKSYVRPAPDLRGLTQSEQSVVMRALSHHADQRWMSCVAFIQQLMKAHSIEPPQTLVDTEHLGSIDANRTGRLPKTKGEKKHR